MKEEEKKDLHCNFKWLHKLAQFGETLITEENINVKLVLLTRHEAFKKELRTSKTKFKKVSAEHLNDTKNFCLRLCEMKSTTNKNTYSTNYHVLFINYQIAGQDVLKYINMMLLDIVHCYFPELSEDDEGFQNNRDMRDMLLTKWSLDLSNSLNDQYMNDIYANSDDIVKATDFKSNINEFKNVLRSQKTIPIDKANSNSTEWQKTCDDELYIYDIKDVPKGNVNE